MKNLSVLALCASERARRRWARRWAPPVVVLYDTHTGDRLPVDGVTWDGVTIWVACRPPAAGAGDVRG